MGLIDSPVEVYDSPYRVRVVAPGRYSWIIQRYREQYRKFTPGAGHARPALASVRGGGGGVRLESGWESGRLRRSGCELLRREPLRPTACWRRLMRVSVRQPKTSVAAGAEDRTGSVLQTSSWPWYPPAIVGNADMMVSEAIRLSRRGRRGAANIRRCLQNTAPVRAVCGSFGRLLPRVDY